MGRVRIAEGRGDIGVRLPRLARGVATPNGTLWFWRLVERAGGRVESRAVFEHEGEARSDQQNRVLAGYLALVAGFVNASGFVVIGFFSSHITGLVGRLVDDTAAGRSAAAALAALLVFCFFVGAFVSSMVVEARAFRRPQYAYATLLLMEAIVLGAFVAANALVADDAGARTRDEEATLLCFAMGMQNSLVTRLSGAVVRTTHLTGIVTDLGIEAARWFRYYRGTVGARAGVRLTVGSGAVERPHGPKTMLLATIFLAFLVGGTSGVLLAHHFERTALLVPIAALLVGAAFALRTGRELVGPTSRK